MTPDTYTVEPAGALAGRNITLAEYNGTFLADLDKLNDLTDEQSEQFSLT